MFNITVSVTFFVGIIAISHPPKYEGYLFVTYLERRVCEETQRALQWLIFPCVGGCGLKNMTTTTTIQ